MDKIAQAADFFAANRRAHHVADNLPLDLRPHDLATAYAIQQSLVERLLDERGGQLVGYKIACTNVSAQRLLGMDAPVFGRLLSSSVHQPPARLAADDFHIRCVESEYAFQMGEDVPAPAAGSSYTRNTIGPFVGGVMPSVEIVDHHFTDWTQVGGLLVAADNAIHGAWIPGTPATPWQDFDLVSERVQLFVNGQVAVTGCGANVLGHPLEVLAWLANELPRYGLQLQAGDRITTGITTEVYLAQAGDELEADFGALGKVRVSFC